MDDPVGGFARAPISATSDAFGDLVGGKRRPLFWTAVVIAGLSTAVVILEWLRPFDISTISDPSHVAGLAVIAAISVLVAVVASRLRTWAKVCMAAATAFAIVLLGGLFVLVVLFGGRDVEASSRVPGTQTSLVVLDSSGIGSGEVVLRGKWGPLSRERVVLDTAGCFVFIRSAGDRFVEVEVTDSSERCDVTGDYRVTVDADGWSTTIERAAD